jgi:periplasmic divalent cation tolerance protein
MQESVRFVMPAEHTEFLVVLTTVATPEDGARIARELVERRLAACVNILSGIRSIYRWQGKIEDDAEVLLLSKTTRERFAALAEAIRELHGYDVPEIVALSAGAVEQHYAAWLAGAVEPGSP